MAEYLFAGAINKIKNNASKYFLSDIEIQDI